MNTLEYIGKSYPTCGHFVAEYFGISVEDFVLRRGQLFEPVLEPEDGDLVTEMIDGRPAHYGIVCRNGTLHDAGEAGVIFTTTGFSKARYARFNRNRR